MDRQGRADRIPAQRRIAITDPIAIDYLKDIFRIAKEQNPGMGSRVSGLDSKGAIWYYDTPLGFFYTRERRFR